MMMISVCEGSERSKEGKNTEAERKKIQKEKQHE